MRKINEDGSVDVASAVVDHGGGTHDAMVPSRHVPLAMLFIPSIGGRSHAVAENSQDSDIIRGCQVLADAVVALIGG